MMANMRNAELVIDTLSNLPRSNSASNTHERSLSGSLLSRISFLHLNHLPNSPQGPRNMEQAGFNEDLPNIPQNATQTGSKAMAAVIQQQRRTRRRRGSLRKTALLGTRLESRDKRAMSKNADSIRADPSRQLDVLRFPKDENTPPENTFPARGSFDDDADDSRQSWFGANTGHNILRPTISRRHQGLAPHNLLNEETATDDEDLLSLPRINPSSTTNLAGKSASAKVASPTALHISTAGSGSYFPPIPADTSYRPAHRAKSSPLATHSVEMQSSADITWDYSETEWWGWIILIVTWLVFVVGIGSCFEVWSWAWDVGETPYAPPELEDDPTLPIVGYYPALIILTAVMSWVWVVVAWVGMKYFKHANISGDDC
ncbi:hypothetical protein N7495_002583 [Penicillium taxi]|uniref:uncharacterized protein n=1 Tax=Penicillium taxi TaxID=168475 RepID=UPI00254566A4|nr:uncharacterized protein N7495_002583 [Penicillium taxi]KAJ5902055.1 hypothetical protein N7495_002583 [Penicillium taxi]